jgi:plastocyanin
MRWLRSVGCCLAAVVGLLPRGAQAGTISGAVYTAATTRGRSDAKSAAAPVVVWVEGPRASGPPADHLVLSQKNVQFSSPLLVVVSGQTVDMPNEDDVAHNVYSSSPPKPFNLGIYGKGEAKSVTFDRVGLIDVKCSIHHRMRADILVVPNSYYTLAAAGSRYEIKDVPAGEYTLHAWSAASPEAHQQITVPATGGVTLDFSLGPAN